MVLEYYNIIYCSVVVATVVAVVLVNKKCKLINTPLVILYLFYNCENRSEWIKNLHKSLEKRLPESEESNDSIRKW